MYSQNEMSRGVILTKYFFAKSTRNIVVYTYMRAQYGRLKNLKDFSITYLIFNQFRLTQLWQGTRRLFSQNNFLRSLELTRKFRNHNIVNCSYIFEYVAMQRVQSANTLNSIEKFYSLPKRYNKIRRFVRLSFAQKSNLIASFRQRVRDHFHCLSADSMLRSVICSINCLILFEMRAEMHMQHTQVSYSRK